REDVGAWDTERQTLVTWRIRSEPVFAVHVGRFRPHNFLRVFEVRKDVGKIPGERAGIVSRHIEDGRIFAGHLRLGPPHSRKVRLATGSARRLRRKVRFAVPCSRSSWSRIVQPLAESAMGEKDKQNTQPPSQHQGSPPGLFRIQNRYFREDVQLDSSLYFAGASEFAFLANIFFPLIVMFFAAPTFEASLARKASIVTTSPGFSDIRVQPLRIRPSGFLDQNPTL